MHSCIADVGTQRPQRTLPDPESSTGPNQLEVLRRHLPQPPSTPDILAMGAGRHLVVLAQLQGVLVGAQAAVGGRQVLLQARRHLVELNRPARQVVPATIAEHLVETAKASLPHQEQRCLIRLMMRHLCLISQSLCSALQLNANLPVTFRDVGHHYVEISGVVCQDLDIQLAHLRFALCIHKHDHHYNDILPHTAWARPAAGSSARAGAAGRRAAPHTSPRPSARTAPGPPRARRRAPGARAPAHGTQVR